MADSALVDALANCLEAMRHGDASLEACLKRYPSFRDELEQLLQIVSLIPKLPDRAAPTPAFRERTRRRLRGLPNGSPFSHDLGWRPDPPLGKNP